MLPLFLDNDENSMPINRSYFMKSATGETTKQTSVPQPFVTCGPPFGDNFLVAAALTI